MVVHEANKKDWKMGKDITGRGVEQANSQRWECTWYLQEMERRRVCLERNAAGGREASGLGEKPASILPFSTSHPSSLSPPSAWNALQLILPNTGCHCSSTSIPFLQGPGPIVFLPGRLLEFYRGRTMSVLLTVVFQASTIVIGMD